MKKIITFLIILLLMLAVLAGVWYAISGSEEKFVTEDIDYYYSMDGSSSVNTEYAVYQYRGEYIFVASYFDCGNTVIETYALNEEQKEKFLEALKDCKINKKLDKDSQPTDGGTVRSNHIYTRGKQYPVTDLDFDSIGITLKAIHSIDFPEDISEKTKVFTSEEIQNLRDTYNDSENAVFFIHTDNFEKMIYDQLVEQTGEEIETVVIQETGIEDFLIVFKTESGKAYEATVTRMGFVDKISTI